MATDEELYSRYLSDDCAEDLAELLERYKNKLFLFLISYTKNAEDAEELMIDTFAKLGVDKPFFRPRAEGSFKSWLYTIGKRNAIMYLRKSKIRTVPLLEDTAWVDNLPEDVLFREEKNRTLYLAMEQIKPEYRQVLYLLYFERMTHKEISDVMGMSVRQIYHLLERGKSALKKQLERMGIYDAQY